MKNLLSLGWICAALSILGSLIFGSLLPDYNLVSMTISEIGEAGSPFYYHWKVLDSIGGVLLLLFAAGVFWFADKHQLSGLPAFFVLSFAISNVGTALFASPHPLHNVFGISTTFGYFSPFIFYLCWKSELGNRFKIISLLTFIVVILGIFFNLSPLFVPTLYPLEYYGLVQRAIVYPFYLYYAYISVSMVRHSSKYALAS